MSVSEGLTRLPGFDHRLFEQLVQDTDPTVVLRILARYSVNMEEAFLDIERGISGEDPEMVWRACHKLIGTAELLGFKKYGEKSRELNLDIKACSDLAAHAEDLVGYLNEGRELLTHIRSCFPLLRNYL